MAERTRKDIEAQIIAKTWLDRAYKQELLENPKAVVSREFGAEVPADITIKVIEEDAKTLYLVLPMKPPAGELSEEQLQAVAGGGLGDIYWEIRNWISSGW